MLAYDDLFDQLDEDFDEVFAVLGAEGKQVDKGDTAASIAILPPLRPVSLS